MAQFQNDPFPGTDYTRYLDWPKVTTPDGNVFYEVPGHPGYVLDPVASNATGRKVFRQNPKGAVESQQKEQDAIEKARKAQEFNQSPAGQAIPVALGVGGLVAANQLVGGGSSAAAQIAAASGAAPGVVSTTAIPSVSAVGGGASGVIPAAGGGSVSAGGAVPAAPGLFSGIGGMTGSAAGLGALGGIAAGTYLGGKSAYDMLRGKEDDSAAGLIGRGTLGIATGGLSEIARPFLMHESTRDVARKHTGQLMDEAGDDQVAKDYVQGMRQQYDSAPVDPSKPFAGKYSSWDEYKANGLEANDLTGVYGNMKTFGPDWAKMSYDDRVKVTQALIDNDLYTSKKGEVEVTDPNRAKQIKDEVLGINVQPKGAAPVQVPGAVIDAAAKNAVKVR
jgi:hypothetical protein